MMMTGTTMGKTMGRSQDRPGPSAGFTLVDALVSMMVLAVGILGLAATVGLVGQQMRGVKVETQLASLARAEMERLLAEGYDRLESGQRDQGPYSIRWEVDGEHPKVVRLITTFDDGGRVQADTLATLVGSG